MTTGPCQLQPNQANTNQPIHHQIPAERPRAKHPKSNQPKPATRRPASLAANQNNTQQQRHQRIPSQPIILSKNQSPQLAANNKRHRLRYLHRHRRSQRGARSTPHRTPMSTLCHNLQTRQAEAGFSRNPPAGGVLRRGKAAMSGAHGKATRPLIQAAWAR